MPSPDASRLTRRHRDAQAAIGRTVARAISAVAHTVQLSDVDVWFGRVLPRLMAIVRGGWIGSRAQSARYLREHAEAEGRLVVPQLALWVPDRVATSLRVTGPVAVKEHIETHRSTDGVQQAMVTRMSGAAQRQALSGGRGTVYRTARESRQIIAWRRVTDADPCAWCAMLASRGAVYLSRAAASGVVGRGRSGSLRGTRQRGMSFHDGDECTVEPLYEDEDEPAEVAALYQQWLGATAGHSGKAAIREWRRYWDKQRQGGGDG